VLAVAGLLAVGGSVCASAAQTANPQRRATVPAHAPCRPLPTAAQYAAAVEATPHDWGADSWSSARLGDGRTLWLLGDTIRPGVFLHSAYVMQDPCGAMTLHADAQLLPDSGVDYFWPVANYTVPIDGGTRVYVTVNRVTPAPDMAGGFIDDGTQIAVLDVANGQQPRYVGRFPLPLSSPAYGAAAHWAEAVVPDGGWLYVFGYQWPRGDPWRTLTLARVPAGRLLDLSAWRFRSGAGWSPTPSDASPLTITQYGLAAQFSVVHDDGRWTILGQFFDAETNAAVTYTASAPWGPWAFGPQALSQPAIPGVSHYAALLHGRLPNGRYLMSVCANPGERALSDPHAYRPEWYEVTLP
jgi:hypothetical protein